MFKFRPIDARLMDNFRSLQGSSGCVSVKLKLGLLEMELTFEFGSELWTNFVWLDLSMGWIQVK